MRSVARALWLLLLLAGSLPANAALGTWDPSFGPSQPDGPIRDAIVFHDEAYFGGDFLVAGRRDTPYVAKFVDERWVKPLGYPFGPVFDFLERDGTLYIAGALATPALYKSYVAYHDGQNWIRLGNLFTVPIQGLAVLGGEFFAFGRGIFRWNGTNWVQEPGITTDSVLWMAELNGELYASHSGLSLFRREGGSWTRLPFHLSAPQCGELGGTTGYAFACVPRAGRLLLLGDFWSIKEIGGATILYSPQIMGFDGAGFTAETHPWYSRCEGWEEIGSQIVHAADLGNEILASGAFVLNPDDSSASDMLALHDGQEWRMLSEYFVSRYAARILTSQGATWVASRAISKLEAETYRAMGHVVRFNRSRRELEPVLESSLFGLRDLNKGAGSATCLAVHRAGVVVAGAFAAPVDLQAPIGLSALYAIEAERTVSLVSPAYVLPTALLSTSRGLYASDSNVIVRIGDGDDREVLISDVQGLTHVLAEYDDALIVGGAFGSLDAVPVLNLARLQDGAIETLGDPDGPVRALAYFQGDLIAGGDFAQIGGITARALARWNGAEWSPMGEPFTRPQFGSTPNVRALCVWRGELYAGGNFTGTDTQDFGHIARWNGIAWEPLTSIDIQAPVNALIVHEDRLIVGGEFLYAGNVFMGHLTAFDGTSWIDLGAQANGNVHALASFDGDLYVGGNFSLLGGWNSYGIARWRQAPRPEPEVPPRYYWFTGVQPNPFNPQASLIFQIPAPGPVEIDIFDNRGRRVRRIDKPWSVAGELRIEWDGTDDAGQPVASGSYQFRASYGGETQTRSAVLVR